MQICWTQTKCKRLYFNPLSSGGLPSSFYFDILLARPSALCVLCASPITCWMLMTSLLLTANHWNELTHSHKLTNVNFPVFYFEFEFIFFPFYFCSRHSSPFLLFILFLLLFFVAAAKNAKVNFTSSDPSVRFKNGVPHHSVDLSASCPRCLAAAAEKPNGSDGEFTHESICVSVWEMNCNVFVPFYAPI